MTFTSGELKEMRLRAFLLAFFLRIFFLLVNVYIRTFIKDLQKPIDFILYFKKFPSFGIIR